jgi:hypothetical protein
VSLAYASADCSGTPYVMVGGPENPYALFSYAFTTINSTMYFPSSATPQLQTVNSFATLGADGASCSAYPADQPSWVVEMLSADISTWGLKLPVRLAVKP